MKTMLISIFLTLVLTSCTGLNKRQYVERTNQILIDENQNIIINGYHYSYIFDTDEQLKNIINWENREILEPNLGRFHVKNNGDIRGDYTLTVPFESITADQQEWLENNGFTAIYGNKLAYHGYMYGKRYPTPAKLLADTGQQYKMSVSEDEIPGQQVGSVVATPMYALLEGAAFLGTFGVMSVAIFSGKFAP